LVFQRHNLVAQGQIHLRRQAMAVEAIANPEILAAAKADHQTRITATPYVCPLPPDVEPPIKMSA
ncbi:MAG: amidohydrolase, partial [Alphaproteobacteria bacterium]